MAAPDPFQQQQGKASIFDETREQNRVTKCILTKAKRKEKREPAEAIGEIQCTVLDFINFQFGFSIWIFNLDFFVCFKNKMAESSYRMHPHISHEKREAENHRDSMNSVSFSVKIRFFFARSSQKEYICSIDTMEF